MKEKYYQAKKSLGQHFLHHKQTIDLITKNFYQKSGSIIEVGPGPGALTIELIKHQQPMIVVEFDQRFIPHLEEKLGTEQVIKKDALTIDWNLLIVERKLPSPVWVVSNLPYNIGSPLFINFIQSEKIDYMTLMFQKEVAQKILGSDKLMSSLYALANTYFEIDLLCKVGRGHFNPPPNVESAVVSLQKKANPKINLSEFKEFESFLRKLYEFKRKTVVNCLKSQLSNHQIQIIINKMQIDPKIRPEKFTLEQVHQLYILVKNKNYLL